MRRRPAAAGKAKRTFSHMYISDVIEKVAWRKHLDDSEAKDTILANDLVVENGQVWAQWPTGAAIVVTDIDPEQLTQMTTALAAVGKRWVADYDGARLSVISVSGGTGLALKIGSSTTCQVLFKPYQYDESENVEDKVRRCLERLGQELADKKVARDDLKGRRKEILAETFVSEAAGASTMQEPAGKRKPDRKRKVSSQDAGPPKQPKNTASPETCPPETGRLPTTSSADNVCIDMFNWDDT